MPPRLSRIPGDVESLLVAGKGLFTLTGAVHVGVTPSRLHRLVRDELLIRLATGVYASQERYGALPPWRAFALRSRAFTLTCGPEACAAGWSAAAIHDLPALSPPPDKPAVVVSKGTRGSWNSPVGQARVATLSERHRTVVHGCPVLTVARTVVDLGRTVPREDALVVADASLAAGTTSAQMREALAVADGWPGGFVR